jgi:hypothetical protein
MVRDSVLWSTITSIIPLPHKLCRRLRYPAFFPCPDKEWRCSKILSVEILFDINHYCNSYMPYNILECSRIMMSDSMWMQVRWHWATHNTAYFPFTWLNNHGPSLVPLTRGRIKWRSSDSRLLFQFPMKAITFSHCVLTCVYIYMYVLPSSLSTAIDLHGFTSFILLSILFFQFVPQ